MMKHSAEDEDSRAPFLFFNLKDLLDPKKKHWQKTNTFLIILTQPGASAGQTVHVGKSLCKR